MILAETCNFQFISESYCVVCYKTHNAQRTTLDMK